MKIKVIIISLILLLSFADLASATTHIPAGTVSSYNLNSAGETYVLDGDVTATGAAFAVGANNITLNGNGYTVTYGSVTGDNAIYNNGYDNIAIKNISIIKSSANTLNTAKCVKIENTALNNTVENSIMDARNATAIYVGANSQLTLLDSHVNSYGFYGLYVIDSMVNVSKSNIVSYTSYAVGVTNGSGSIFSDSDMQSNTNWALYATNTNNTTYTNCTVHTTTNTAWYFTNVSNATVINSAATSNDNYGFLMADGSKNNKVINVTAYSKNSIAFYSLNTTGNNVSDSVFRSDLVVAVRLKNTTNENYNNITVISPYANTETSGKPLLLEIGDSITDGNPDASLRGGWGKYVNNSGKYSVSNHGIGGLRASQARTTFPSVCDIYKPNIVTIFIGTNDLYDARSQQLIIDDVLWMATEAKNKGITPYIILTPARNDSTASSIIPYDTALKTQAEAAGYRVINAYDAIDSIPQNGIYDSFTIANQFDSVHPNAAGLKLIADHIERNINGYNQQYMGSNLSCVYESGNIRQSREIRSNDTAIPMRIIPVGGSLNVSVTAWSTNNKAWAESSADHSVSARHIIGDFPVNTPIQILRDSANYAVATSNSTGYIDWTYSGGYSEHTFEATVDSPITLTVTSLNALNSSSEAATNVTLSAETQYTGMGALYNSVRDTISSGYTLASLIVLVIGAYALFRYMGYI